MPKIRVEFDVPDGEKCDCCRFCEIGFTEGNGYYRQNMFCQVFSEYVYGDRLPQCIAAEVKDAEAEALLKEKTK